MSVHKLPCAQNYIECSLQISYKKTPLMKPAIKPLNKILFGGVFSRVAILNLVFLLAWLNACGFQLKGTNLQALQNANIYVQSSNANILAAEVKQQLLGTGVKLIKNSSGADYVVTLSNESFETRVLSVSASSGKAIEYEISYAAQLKITKRDDEKITIRAPISASRDFSFRNTVLGKNEEKSILKKDIAKQAAATVLRRLRFVIQ